MTLYEFYGDGCPHCEKMKPVVEEVEEEEDVEIEQLEVWHSEENAEKMKGFDNNECRGVPYFYNTESGQSICGEASKEKVAEWANGEKID